MSRKTNLLNENDLVSGKLTPQRVKEIYKLLTDIHSGLTDKNTGKDILKIPTIELCWMLAIEEFLPEEKQLIKSQFKKSKPFSN